MFLTGSRGVSIEVSSKISLGVSSGTSFKVFLNFLLKFMPEFSLEFLQKLMIIFLMDLYEGFFSEDLPVVVSRIYSRDLSQILLWDSSQSFNSI